ncbi:hypothetical protein NQZ68_034422 [Dissostichus eleginoides]|nr:hypothetical protein NQZ68_034422 [Dissostichus eleginoides]
MESKHTHPTHTTPHHLPTGGELSHDGAEGDEQVETITTEYHRLSDLSGPANVSLSKPGQARRMVCNDRSVTSDAVTLRTLVTLLCKKKAPLCGGEEQSIVGVCLGSWRGEAKFSLSSYGKSPNSHNVQGQEQVVIVSHSEKYSELQCDIVRDTRYLEAVMVCRPCLAAVNSPSSGDTLCCQRWSYDRRR